MNNMMNMQRIWELQEPQADFTFVVLFVFYSYSAGEYVDAMLLTNCTKEDATISSDVTLALKTKYDL